MIPDRPPAQQSLSIAAAIDLALRHHRAGRLTLAERLYRHVLQRQPQEPTALHYLGVLAHQAGQDEEAVRLISRSLSLRPDDLEALINLASIHQRKGRLEEATARLLDALALAPARPDVLSSLAATYMLLARYDDALPLFEVLLQQDPEETDAQHGLLRLLTRHRPSQDGEGAAVAAYLTAQRALEGVSAELAAQPLLDDATVTDTHRRCRGILVTHGLAGLDFADVQIFKGQSVQSGCRHYRALFFKQAVIAAHCFGCYKVVAEPKRLVDLFKLAFLFNEIELPRHNSRKCMIDVRPGIAGAYKAYLYGYDLADAEDILARVQAAMAARIEGEIPVSVKRGCSEFRAAYPDYGRSSDDGAAVMVYPEAWNEVEESFFARLREANASHIERPSKIRAITLADALVLRNWAKHATVLGDRSMDEAARN